MAETFVIRISHDLEPATWTVLDEYGRPLGAENSGDLSAASAAAGERRVMLLVPGIDVLLLHTQLPVKGHSRQLKMVPFSLEEGLAADVETLHFAIGTVTDSDDIPVAVTARDLLLGWLEGLKQANLRPASIFCDAEGVPDTPGTLTVLVDAGCIYLRQPGEQPVTLDGVDLVQALSLSLTEEHYARTHVLIYGDEGHLSQYQSYLGELRERVAGLDVQVLADGVLQRLGATLLADTGIDLLQGELAPRSDWLGMLKPWRFAAALAAGFVALALLNQAIDYWSLQRRTTALETIVDETCASVFPGSNQQTCLRQVNDVLSIRGGSDGAPVQPFLPTLAAVGSALNDKSRLQALDYRSGVTNLRVLAPDVATLDGIQRAIASSGAIEVNIQSANPVDGGVEGRLQVRGQNP
jgi:general secretion pathway protein L